MTIKEITSKKEWDSFLKTYQGFPPFFQLWDWGEVQKKLGFVVSRIGVFEAGKVVGIAQLVEVRAKRGNYIHLRHAPVIVTYNKKYLTAVVSYVKKVAQEKHFDFLRISPLIEETKEVNSLLRDLGFRSAPVHNMDAEVCWVLDITLPEEQLLANMRKSHRYLIKKSLKEPIEIVTVEKIGEELDAFLQMYKKLAHRREFVAHRGIAEELDILGKNKEAILLIAKYEGKIVGGALIAFTEKMAIYHHGASDETYRHLSVSYLLQWHAILEAKKRGKKLYNFWGISPTDNPKHPWYGLSLFKTGFGGEKKEFLHAQDLPLGIGYYKTFLIEFLTKLRKGY